MSQLISLTTVDGLTQIKVAVTVPSPSHRPQPGDPVAGYDLVDPPGVVSQHLTISGA